VGVQALGGVQIPVGVLVPVQVQVQVRQAVVGLGCADEYRQEFLTRRERYLSRSRKRRKPCGRRRMNLFEIYEGGWEPSLSSQDGPTRAPTDLAAVNVDRPARKICADAAAHAALRGVPLREKNEGGGDDDGETTSP
jgi:hypothetical protein